MLIDELAAYIFDGQPHFLSAGMETWLVSSRRFAAFVDTFRDKIRKKIRGLPDQESILDLGLELESAYLLLQERPFSVVYEPDRATGGRGTDFAVSYTTRLTFMLEVTRMRAEAADQNDFGARLSETICGKLGQMQAQRSNVLLVGVESQQLTANDLRSIMLNLQQRAERNELPFLNRYFRDRADFFQHYLRLSEVLVRDSHLQSSRSAVGWLNPQARHPLPSKVRTALYHSHTG